MRHSNDVEVTVEPARNRKSKGRDSISRDSGDDFEDSEAASLLDSGSACSRRRKNKRFAYNKRSQNFSIRVKHRCCSNPSRLVWFGFSRSHGSLWLRFAFRLSHYSFIRLRMRACTILYMRARACVYCIFFAFIRVLVHLFIRLGCRPAGRPVVPLLAGVAESRSSFRCLFAPLEENLASPITPPFESSV